MCRRLLPLGLVVVPFFELIIYWILPHAQLMPHLENLRVGKEYMALLFASLIVGTTFYTYPIKPLKIFWFYAFFCYLIINITKYSYFKIDFSGLQIAGFYNFKPAFIATVYFAYILAIYSTPIKNRTYELIFKTIMWCGVVMGGYAVMQFLKIEQGLTVKPAALIGLTNSPSIAGAIGQPTLCAAFLCLCIPFTVYYKKIWALLLILAGIAVTRSDMGALAAIACLVFYFVRSWQARVAVATLSLCYVALVFYFTFTVKNFLVQFNFGSGRIETWILAIKDLYTSNNLFTGMGIGAFGILNPIKNKSTWLQAHNEYVEILYGMGYVGLAIVLIFIFCVFREIFKKFDDRKVRTLGAALFASCFLALGNFVWQHPALQFYSVTILALILNKTKGEESEKIVISCGCSCNCNGWLCARISKNL